MSVRRTAALVGLALSMAVTTVAPAVAAPGDATHPRTSFVVQPDGSSGLTQGGEGIPNIDVVKSTIRTYYGATGGIADKQSSPYISEMARRAGEARRYLDSIAGSREQNRRKAIVLDTDDTTLWTYDMEDGAMKFNFDPALQNYWVQHRLFPATPSMVALANEAKRRGFTVFGLTGRNDGQKHATLVNLDHVGYRAFTRGRFFTKWVSGTTPSDRPYLDGTPCEDGVCTTVEYKSLTRKHIEDLGYDVVLNVGDQWSDLQGGYADRTLKLPNPTYFLPSPDLDGTPADPGFRPRSRFRVLPDGSSGRTEGGEGIPNIDVVKATIRTYYGASGGIADKQSSPYISEVTRLAAARTRELTRTCAEAVEAGRKPAVVLDTDDTTLWTYDMEDGAMKFNFDPALQDHWVQDRLFPATPGMVGLADAVHDAGCTLVGLTGRNDRQKEASLANLDDVGYDGFTSGLYFTKWVSGTTPTDRPWLDGTPCEDGVCTTVEYKSLTRKHLVEDLGYDVVANLGDQFSDLAGGYADETVKLPNPTYYLP